MDILTKFPARSSQIASRIIEGEAIIVIPQEGVSIVLNAVGSRIWELLDGKKTVKDIIDTIIVEFETPSEEAQQDVCDFFKQLENKKMLVMNKR